MEINGLLINNSTENSKSGEANATDPPALTAKQAELIRQTWALVKVDLEGAGYILFTKLFQIAPDLINQFPFKDAVDQAREEGLRKHGLQVMTSIDGAIGLLNQPEMLEDTLTELGIVHNMKSVKVESFGPVGEALIYTLGQGLQEKFTKEVQEAWVVLYTNVQHFMSLGMEEGL